MCMYVRVCACVLYKDVKNSKMFHIACYDEISQYAVPIAGDCMYVGCV